MGRRGRGGDRGGGGRGGGKPISSLFGSGGGGDGDDYGSGGRQGDQYGETMKTQDRDQGPHPSRGGGMTGGGAAGKSSRSMDLNYKRQMPKFLQQYAHMLGQKPEGSGSGGPNDEDPVMVDQLAAKRPRGDEGSDSGDDEVELDALRRAAADNPALASELGDKLQLKLKAAQAQEEKERGNRAFGAKQYEEAVKSFTRCIHLDPRCEIYYSNRSAAHALLGDWAASKTDAVQATHLKPKWAKGWARLGAAYLGLQLCAEAREAYEKALALEPEDQTLQKGMEKATYGELQQMREHKHTFKKLRTSSGSVTTINKEAGPSSSKGGEGAARNKKHLLSFVEDEEGDEG